MSAPGRAGRVATAVLGASYTAVVLWATLRPLPWATEGDQERYGILDPGAWIGWSTWAGGSELEIIANVLVFVPIGLAAGLLFRGVVAFALPVGLTLTIELAQIPLVDQISHPRDLVANASGAVLGLLIAGMVRRSRSASVQDRHGPVA